MTTAAGELPDHSQGIPLGNGSGFGGTFGGISVRHGHTWIRHGARSGSCMLLEWLSVGSRLLASFHGSDTRDVCTCGTAVELRSEAQVHVEPPGLWGPGYAQSWR